MCELVKHFSPCLAELTWRNGDSESAVVAHNHVSQWYQGLQEGLQKRADVAAKVMLAISKESGFTTRPSRGGEEVVSSDGKLIQERDYNLLRKMVHEEPTHFHQLLSATERLLLDFDAQQGKMLTYSVFTISSIFMGGNTT